MMDKIVDGKKKKSVREAKIDLIYADSRVRQARLFNPFALFSHCGLNLHPKHTRLSAECHQMVPEHGAARRLSHINLCIMRSQAVGLVSEITFITDLDEA